MNAPQEPAGEGSPVDDDVEVSHDQTPSCLDISKEVQDETNPQTEEMMFDPNAIGDPRLALLNGVPITQAVVSDAPTCPYSMTQQEEVKEDSRPNYQQACYNQDKTCEAPPEQMQVTVNQNNQETVLKELKDVMLKCFKYPPDAEHLKDCINTTSIPPEKLLQFFQKYLLLHKKSGKGGKNSDGSVEPYDKVKNSTSSASHRWLSPTVKVFPVVTGQTCGAHDVILKKVNKGTFRQCAVEIATVWQDCDIIIVFCPITCRVGSDVEAAMRNIPDSKPAILVLMHHTRDVDYSTDVKIWSDDYQNVVLDVHVLFHETLQGLLKCSRNDQAAQQIQKTLNNHSKYAMFR